MYVTVDARHHHTHAAACGPQVVQQRHDLVFGTWKELKNIRLYSNVQQSIAYVMSRTCYLQATLNHCVSRRTRGGVAA